jgi:site-specific DNA-methyltransferase (adenine-specific)
VTARPVTDFALVDVASIKTTRILSDGRKRLREIKGIPELKTSLEVYGQLQPIIIERDGELVDGLRRLTAAKELGWPTVGAVFRDQMDDLLARTLELEANVQRQDMGWAERTFALTELHRIKQRLDPAWSQATTAQLTGSHQARVAEAIMVSKMMELFPEIKEAKSFNQALSWSKAKAGLALRVNEVRDAGPNTDAVADRIILGDSVDVIKNMPDASVHLILTDPPFGIDYDTRKTGTESTLTTYEDTKENYLRLLTMAPDIFRVLKKDAWLIWFLGPSWYEHVKLVFREAGFIVDEIPVIWKRDQVRAFTSRPDRYFARGYDMALHCIKGDPQMVQRGKSNVFDFPPVGTESRELTVERPVELYQEFIRRLTVEGEMVLDLFTGSGSVLAAAASLRRNYFGVELSPERRAVAIQKVLAYTPEAK